MKNITLKLLNKTCDRCNVSKTIDSFNKNCKNCDGYLHQGKACVAKKVKELRLKNPELYKKRRKDRYWSNRAESIKSAIEWGRKNKEKRKIAKNKWRAKNKPLTNHYTKNYIYRNKGAKGSHSLEEYKLKLLEFGGMCAYCKVSRAATKDHVIPLSKGGTNYIRNIVPACVTCNSSKRDKFLSEWRALTVIN